MRTERKLNREWMEPLVQRREVLAAFITAAQAPWLILSEGLLGRGSNTLAVALAVSDLPVPGMPAMSSPLRTGRPYSRARSLNASRRLSSQLFSWSKPPMASSGPAASTISSRPFLRMASEVRFP